MKRRFFLPLLLSTLILFTLNNCSDDNWFEIDSLLADGNEFFSNQKVKLWMAVRSGELHNLKYEWTCEGGKFTQPQGIDEIVWQAPAKTGIYRISCTVIFGKVRETRHRDLLVSSFYFERFEKSTHSFRAQANTTITRRTESIGGKVNGYLEAFVNATNQTDRYVFYNFAGGLPQLPVPFGFSAILGVPSNFPKAPIRVGTANYDNKLVYHLALLRDPKRTDASFIDEIRFEWFPVGNTNGLPFDPVSSLPWNGRLHFRSNLNGATTVYYDYVLSDDLYFLNNERKGVAINIDSDFYIHVYTGGKLILKSDKLRNWRLTNNSQDMIYINEWRYIFPNGNLANNRPVMYIDNAIGANEPVILTGE